MLYAVHENIKQSYKPISNVLEVVLKNLEFYEKFFHETPLSNLMQAQSTFLYLSGYFIMKTDHYRCFCCNSRIRLFIPPSLLITAINCSLQ